MPRLCGQVFGAFPVHDWQFWVATGVAIAAAAWLAWKLLPLPMLKRWRRGRRGKRATLTIEGEKPADRGKT